MTWSVFGILAVALMLAALGYNAMAERFGILDHPNERSSHTRATVRGAGILFPLAYVLYLPFAEIVPWAFAIGFAIVSIVSFADDVRGLRRVTRILAQLVGVGLIGYELGLFDSPVLVVPFLVLAIGIINAFNFMDGINGIHGLYSLAVLTGLYLAYLEHSVGDPDLLRTMMVAIVVFGFFNFRSRARCFGGDVGSVSMAFMIVYLLVEAIAETGQYPYALFMIVYGVDAVFTILARLGRGENIFQAHRSHLYQRLCNELGFPHLLVAAGYAASQLGLILILVYQTALSRAQLTISLTLAVGAGYLAIRHIVERRIASGTS